MSDDTIHGHDEFLEASIALLHSFPKPPGVELRLPPPSTKELDIRFEEYTPGRELIATVVVPERYTNAVGALQGGMLAAIFDDVMGPLSYLVAQNPTATLDLNTHFMRSPVAGDRLRIEATVRKAGRSAVFVAGDALDEKGRLVATAMATFQVLAMPGT